MSERERDEASEKGFVVVDRRGRSDEERAEEASPPPRESPPPTAKAAPHPTDQLPPLDFAGFAHSIAISALHQLGLVPDPETGKPAPPNFDLARQNIDILEMLQAKTRGNLDADESRLLESLLYELRMRFVEVSGSRPR